MKESSSKTAHDEKVSKVNESQHRGEHGKGDDDSSVTVLYLNDFSLEVLNCDTLTGHDAACLSHRGDLAPAG